MTPKQIKAQAGRYLKFVEWSDEDGCFVGRCPEIMSGGVHGADESKVYAELCLAVEEMVALMNEDGLNPPDPISRKPHSGRFVLRVDPAMHGRLVVKALAARESLNTFCVRALLKA